MRLDHSLSRQRPAARTHGLFNTYDFQGMFLYTCSGAFRQMRWSGLHRPCTRRLARQREGNT